ncbi:disulfide bond formation protein B [Arenibaculum pallidiluteum]|uniref:disulfide bond formation protein B n=1 Tax=Arenibaculum pallidiluteum TaxID=2812559 RepID=UPI001A9794D8|nr:disulfide bond formation protein B [Arenibaculum pallidiluteum]
MSFHELLGSRRGPALVLILASAGLLLGAVFFQYVVGLAPCVLCIYQRWPHGIVLALGLLALLAGGRERSRARGGLLALSGVVLLLGAGIAVFHVGVEQRWWEGLASCTGGTGATTVDALRAQILNAPVVRCDDIAWSLFGISMAGYNALISVALAAFAFLAAGAALHPRRTA